MGYGTDNAPGIEQHAETDADYAHRLLQKVGELQSRVADLEHIYDCKAQQVVELQKRIAELEAEAKGQERDYAYALKERDQLRAQVGELEGDVKYWKGERDEYWNIRCKLREQLSATKAELLNEQYWKQSKDTEIDRLRAELKSEQGRLQNRVWELEAELEALKPKPVVKVMGVRCELKPDWVFGGVKPILKKTAHPSFDNLKLTFEDGKLVNAEVIK